MVEPNDPSRPSSAVRQPVLLGLFAGTAVGGGYLLAWLPNVEIMTVITAVAGVVLGPVLGFLCGAMAAGIYSIASPMGAAPPLLLLAQMLGMGLAGPVGHVAAGRVDGVAGRVSRRAVARAAAGGLVATVLYDALTNLAGLLIFDLPLPVVLVGAVPFFLVHAASNVAIFAVFLPVLASRMAPLARPRVTGRPGTPGAAACLTVGLIVASVTLAAAPGQAQDSLPETGAVVPAVADTAAAGHRGPGHQHRQCRSGTGAGARARTRVRRRRRAGLDAPALAALQPDLARLGRPRVSVADVRRRRGRRHVAALGRGRNFAHAAGGP
ncbi:MAG: hypothetical protein IPI48_06625 [bacterium]|nr:hypothetical protein [bacterium]